MLQLSRQAVGRKGQIPPSSASCSVQALSGLDDAHPTLERVIHLTEFTSNADFVWEHLEAILNLGTFWPVEFTQKQPSQGANIKYR